MTISSRCRMGALAVLVAVPLAEPVVASVVVVSVANAGLDKIAAMQKASRAGLRKSVVEVGRVMGCPKVVVG